MILKLHYKNFLETYLQYHPKICTRTFNPDIIWYTSFDVVVTVNIKFNDLCIRFFRFYLKTIIIFKTRLLVMFVKKLINMKAITDFMLLMDRPLLYLSSFHNSSLTWHNLLLYLSFTISLDEWITKILTYKNEKPWVC